MRCYMSKQSIARFCFLGGVLFLMLSLLPFPHKEDDRLRKDYQYKQDILRSSKTPAEKSYPTKQNAKPVVFEIKDNKHSKPIQIDKKVQNKEQEPIYDKKDGDKYLAVKQSDSKFEKVDQSTSNKVEAKPSEKKKEPIIVKAPEIKSGETARTSKLQNDAGNIQQKVSGDILADKNEKKTPDTIKQESPNTTLKVKTVETIMRADKLKQETAKVPQASYTATKLRKDDEKPTNTGKQGIPDTELKVKASEMIKPADKTKQEVAKNVHEGPPKISQQKSIEQPKVKADKPLAQKDSTGEVVNRPSQRKVQSISDSISDQKQRIDAITDNAKIGSLKVPESVNTKQVLLQDSNDRIEPIKMPVFGNSQIRPVIIPEPAVLKSMGQAELQELFFLYIENLQTHCIRQRHVGNQEFGGYHICEDVMVFNPCLVYSFGSPNDKDNSFEEEMARRYGCEVHVFGKTPSQVSYSTPNLNFHGWKVGEMNIPSDNVSTLASLKARVGHQHRKINILQMDINYREWTVLDEICNGIEINDVTLLLVEFHLCSKDCKNLNVTGQEMYVQYLSLMRRLYNMGFRIYFFKMWSSCTYYVDRSTRIACHDIHMIRMP